MNPMVLALGAAGAGYFAWSHHKKTTQNAQVLGSFTALLSDDDKYVTDAAKKVPIAQTAANLTAMYFRKNKSELTVAAKGLLDKGYTKTSQNLNSFAMTL
jgi:hypothetical protein